MSEASIILIDDDEGVVRLCQRLLERANFEVNNCVVSLDKLGNMYFIEVEGKEKDIEKVLKKLELENEVLEKRSYFKILGGKHGLYRKNI